MFVCLPDFSMLECFPLFCRRKLKKIEVNIKINARILFNSKFNKIKITPKESDKNYNYFCAKFY